MKVKKFDKTFNNNQKDIVSEADAGGIERDWLEKFYRKQASRIPNS